MWHAPINGSQINPPAKLYKRFTASDNSEISGDCIKYNGKYYRSRFDMYYTEATDKDSKEYFSTKGVLTPSSHLQIKFNGEYYAESDAFHEPSVGDLILIKSELWIIQEIRKKRLKLLLGMAVVYLDINKIQRD